MPVFAHLLITHGLAGTTLVRVTSRVTVERNHEQLNIIPPSASGQRKATDSEPRERGLSQAALPPQ